MDDTIFQHAYFGVFDGHGGSGVSEHCATHLHANVLSSTHMPDVLQALQDGFLRTDADVLDEVSAPDRSGARRRGWDAGTAAVAMFVTAQDLAFAHAGDCRAVLVKRSGSPVPFVDLTIDHAAAGVPDRPDEVIRVEKVGGKISPGHVYVGDYSLPMTRALGDLPLKVAADRSWREMSVGEQIVTALPEVSMRPREDDDLCVVLASDGLFGNVMSSADVAKCAREHLEGANANAHDAEMKAARSLCDQALCLHHGADNVSVVVVSLDAPVPPPLPSSSSRAAYSMVNHRFSVPGIDGPVPLAHMGSQESVTTADPTSPGRLPLSEKLRMRFCDAYPPCALSRDKENYRF